MNRQKLLSRISKGSLSNIAFSDLAHLAEGFGFQERRIRGSHHIFTHPVIPYLLNLQDVNGQAKPYQIRQFLKLIERYNLELEGRA